MEDKKLDGETPEREEVIPKGIHKAKRRWEAGPTAEVTPGWRRDEIGLVVSLLLFAAVGMWWVVFIVGARR